MVHNIQAAFLRGRNAAVLREWDALAYQRCLLARTLPELMEAHAPFALRNRTANMADYYRAHDPMADRHGVSVPMLLLNAEDDFVCPVSLAQPEVVQEQPGSLLLVTESGSHVAFNEGMLARGAFHMRTSFDFLDAALVTAPKSGESAAQNMQSVLDDVAERGVVVPANRVDDNRDSAYLSRNAVWRAFL